MTENKLFDAFMDGTKEEVEQILKEEPELLNKPYNKNGWTPFMWIVKEYEDPQVIKHYIELGGDVNARTTDRYGETPFLVAARKRSSARCLYILKEAGTDVSATYKDGTTSLIVLVLHPHLSMREEVFNFLLYDCNTNIFARTDTGETAFDICIRKNRSDLAKLIQAQMNKKHKPSLQEELINAIKSKRLSLVKFLVREGANLNKPFNKLKTTPFMYALHYFKKSEEMEELIKLGGDMNTSNINGKTPLMCAVDEDCDSITPWLFVDCGLEELDAQDDKGNTALMRVLLSNKLKHKKDLIMAFIDYGADLTHLKNKANQTAWDLLWNMKLTQSTC